MQSDTISPHPKITKKWRKVKRVTGLYQYLPTGMFFARVRHGGMVYRERLKTNDLAFAKRKLRDFKARLDRTDPRYRKITLVDWLEKIYAPTLKNAPGALKAKERIITRIKDTWHFARTQPMRDLTKSKVLAWLNEHYGDWSESYWNSALSLIRDALALAVDDRVIAENPIADVKYQKRAKPIRPTPTWEQFRAIIADVRAQQFNADAQDSGDFLEAMGLLGLGQAELSSIRRADVDLDAGLITTFRHKTEQGFTVPIFPQARPLVERLCEGKRPNQRLFVLDQARKALSNACKRLGFVNDAGEPTFSHRSFRRMFITRAIERGVDVQTLSQWQGHRDGGKLILQTYAHVRAIHSRRMAQLMTDQEPDNVLRMEDASARSTRKSIVDY
jgi:integrase